MYLYVYACVYAYRFKRSKYIVTMHWRCCTLNRFRGSHNASQLCMQSEGRCRLTNIVLVAVLCENLLCCCNSGCSNHSRHISNAMCTYTKV